MRRGFASIGAALVIMAVMASSFLTGVKFGTHQSQSYVIDGTPVPTALQQPFYDLWQGYKDLNSDSYWRPFPDQKQLIYHAIEGMLLATSAQDSHTLFLEPAVNTVESSSLNQVDQFGIGASVLPTPKGLLITPLVGSPAQHAGLQPGDVITRVNGQDITHMAEEKAVGLIHGAQGTAVTLTILRPGVARPFDVKVTRGIIPSVANDIIGSTGVIRFQGFDIDTATEVHKNLQYLESRHIKSLIIDLRDNPGGYVDTAIAIASEFLPRGAIIYWERDNVGNGHITDTAVRVTKPGVAERLPIAILVNGNTASAAEILTAALREHGRATVIGTTTYGKGSEQENIALPDGSALRITTHLWLTPQKHWVQNGGIMPDIQVAPGTTSSGQDSQILRAVQYLQDRH